MNSDNLEAELKQCPSPDCDLEFPTNELADHVNSEHPGEFKRDGWPDTQAGRETRAQELVEDQSSEDQPQE